MSVKNRKKPFLSAEKLRGIVEEHPTPFHLYHEAGIRETARRVNAAFAWNEGFKEYFAVKANPNPTLLSILKEEGCGVDCASLPELMLAEELGFSGGEIMFSSNVTPAEEFVYARKLNACINLDDYGHIDFLARTAGVPKTICCRYNPGGDFGIHTHYMSRPEEAKYGFTKAQLLAGLPRLAALGAKNFGLHAFLASNTLGEDYYPALARTLFEMAALIKAETGIEVGFINLSGGIGIPYRPGETPCDIMAIGQGVRRAYEEILIPAGLGHVRLCAELGRYMLGPHGCLVSRVLHIKETYRRYVGLDACAAHLMRPAMYGAYHHITVVGREDEPVLGLCDVTGGLCENNDKFAVQRPLPMVEPGELVVIYDTGAHGHAMGYNYNGKLRSAELLLREDGSVSLIRRAETPQDYFATVRGLGCSL